MKTIFNKISSGLWLLAVSIFALLSVSGCIEEEMPFIVLDNDVVTVDASTSKTSVDVKANVKWTAASDQAWCKIYSTEGNYKGKFDFVVDPNPTTEERTALITVSAADGSIKTTLMVKQAPIGAKLFISEEELTFNRNAGTRNIAVVSNHNWSVISSSDWCTVSPDSGKEKGNIEVKVTANDTGKERKACVTVVCEVDGDPFIKTVDVVQAATDFFFYVPVSEFNLSNVEKTLEIAYDVDGDDVDITAETNVDWISFSDIVEGADQVIAQVAANTTGKARSGRIILSASNNGGEPIAHVIEVNQSATDFFFVVPVKEYDVTNAETTLAIPYETEGDKVEIKGETNSKWITINGVLEGSNEFEIVVAKNATGKARTGKLVLTASNNGGEPIVQVVTISQSAKDFYFTVPVKEFDITNAGGLIGVDYKAEGDDVKIEYRTNADWISFNDFVEGAGQIEVVVEPNKTGKERIGKVVLSASNNGGEPIEYTVVISQSAKDFYFVVPVKNYDLSNLEKELAFKYEVEGDKVSIKYETNVDWIEFKDFVEGSGQIEAVVAENKTGEPRSAKVILTASNNGGEPIVETIEINQSAKDFFFVVPVTEHSISFEDQDLPIEYKVEGDSVKVEYKSNVEWIEFKEYVEGSNQVVAEIEKNRTGEERVGKVILTASNNGGEPIVRTVVITQAASGFYFVVPVDEYNLNNKEHQLEINFQIEGEGLELEPTTNVDWITIDDMSIYNGYLKVTVEPNKTGKPRTGEILLTGSSNDGEPIVRKVIINQSAKDFFFVVPIKNYNVSELGAWEIFSFFNYDGDKVNIHAESNVPWIEIEAEILKENYPENIPDEYVGMLSGDGFIVFNVAPNATGIERSGQITLTASNNNGEPIVEVINIVQSKQNAHFELTKDSFIMGPEGGITDIGGLIHLTSVEESDPELGETVIPILVTFDSDSEWTRFRNGSGSAEIYMDAIEPMDMPVRVEKNETGKERKAQIKVTAYVMGQEAIVRYFTITQQANEIFLNVPFDTYDVTELGVEELEILFTEGGDNIVVEAQTNVPWISNIQVSQNHDGVDGAGVVLIDVFPNLSGQERTAQLAISATGNNGEPIVKVVEIVQGKQNVHFTLLQDKLSFGPEGGKTDLEGVIQLKDIHVEEDLFQQWAIPASLFMVSDAEWLTFKGGKQYKTIDLEDLANLLEEDIHVAANTANVDRSAELTLTCLVVGQEAIVRKVVVEQTGNKFSLVVPHQQYEFAGLNQDIAIDFKLSGDDVVVEATSNAPWATVTSVDQSGKKVNINLNTNSSKEARTADIAIMATDSNGKTIAKTVIIKQYPKTELFIIPKTEYTITADKQTLIVPFLADDSVSGITLSEDAEWIEGAYGDMATGILKINVLENLGSTRTAEVTVNAWKDGLLGVYTIKVVQN